MCSNFCQEMDTFQGDLADIVRASGNMISNTTNHTSHNTFDQLSNLFDSNSTNISREDKTMKDEQLVQAAGFSPAASNNNNTNNIYSSSMLQISSNNNNNNNNMKVGMGIGIGRGYGMMCNEMMIRNKNGSFGDTSEVGAVQIPSPRNQGMKRRKIQARKVVCIPAPAAANSRQTGEVVPSDLWAWRKYGQKPIKGSPYPRGYYRCSSSKGCSARKQVERSRTDPNMLVITYTSEHNHPWPTQRNALAGSTRSSSSNKPPSQKQINNNNLLLNDPNSSKTSSNSPIKQEQRSDSELMTMTMTDDDRASDIGLMTMTMTDDNRAGNTGLMTMTMSGDNRTSDTGLMTMTMSGDSRASDTGLMTMTVRDDDKVQDELIRINENDELFNDSYRPLIMAESSTNQDFFADLGEFEGDEDPLKMFNTNTFSGLFDDWSINNNITINEDTIEKKG